jgi:hypothetical protein
MPSTTDPNDHHHLIHHPGIHLAPTPAHPHQQQQQQQMTGGGNVSPTSGCVPNKPAAGFVPSNVNVNMNMGGGGNVNLSAGSNKPLTAQEQQAAHHQFRMLLQQHAVGGAAAGGGGNALGATVVLHSDGSSLSAGKMSLSRQIPLDLFNIIWTVICPVYHTMK